MRSSFLSRLVRPVVDVREEESMTMLLMFLYSFLAMTSYNILKPLTRSQFIRDLGADNLPYVVAVAGVLIGIIMQVYTMAIAKVPRRAVIPATQGGMVALMLAFWVLFQTDQGWVSAAFYLYGLILGILLISQFWTLANDVYDPRQAKRLFGFIGGGASLGGILGSAILTFTVAYVGPTNLLLVSAALLVLCGFIVVTILGRAKHIDLQSIASAGEEKGVSGSEALRLLRESKHLQIIAMVIGFAAIGAAIIEQQLNLAAEQYKGQEAGAALEAFFGQVQLLLSLVGFTIQIWLTSRIHRLLGIGFALLILPTSLGLTGLVMLLNGALWAPALARILDTSLRYTVDKTTREILFLPLPTELKYRAKPFVDVTVDRFAKGCAGLLTLVLIKPWGFGFTWQQLSYASLTVTALWIIAAVAARRGYLASFRKSIERRDVKPADVRLNVADLSTVETLIEELAHPDEQRVLYAIDVLESLDKRNLITPLLLYHSSERVRTRTLGALSAARPDIVEKWLPNIQALMADHSPDVRAAAVQALANIRASETVDLARPLISSSDPRIATTAAQLLAQSQTPEDVASAEATLSRLAAATGPSASQTRRDVASAIGRIANERFNPILIPLVYDSDPRVAEEAMHSVQRLGTANYLFVPVLVSLLRNRRLKSAARDVLVSYGEDVVDALAHFLADPEEDIWVRRHIPATLARIPSQRSLDVLMQALAREQDGFLRFKVLAAIERITHEHADLTFDKAAIEPHALQEGRTYFRYLSLRYNLIQRAKLSKDGLLPRALQEKMERSIDRIYRIVGLLYPWRDVAAARWAIEHGDAKARSSGLEYLDNLFTGAVRKQLLPAIEDLPLEEKVRRANSLLKSRPRDLEETLLELINEDDQVIAATAINLAATERVTGLVDDIEHVLAHRDAKDWYVFETASWALAAFRFPEDRRRSLWHEPLPAVELADRLRQLPTFARVSVDELFRIGSTGRQVRYEAGRMLYQAGSVPEGIQFLLDGRVELVRSNGQRREVGPPAQLAFQETLQGSPVEESCRTVERSVCLLLTLDESRTLLADNTDLVQGLFQTVIEHEAFGGSRSLAKGTGGAPTARAARAPQAMTPIEKVLALQQMSLFSAFTADETLHLAGIAQEITLEAGTPVIKEGDAPALVMVLEGEISVARDGSLPPLVADVGDAIGLYETLAGIPLGATATATESGRALRVTHDDLFDLLSQRPDMLQQLFAALFGRRAAVEVAA